MEDLSARTAQEVLDDHLNLTSLGLSSTPVIPGEARLCIRQQSEGQPSSGIMPDLPCSGPPLSPFSRPQQLQPVDTALAHDKELGHNMLGLDEFALCPDTSETVGCTRLWTVSA